MDISFIHRSAHDAITHAKRVLIVSHPSPDGDTLGAACAMLAFCRAHGIPADAWCKDEVPPQYAFMARTEEFGCDPAVFTREAHDVLCVFDAGDLRYAGIDALIPLMPERPRIINFDHHSTNEKFGDINVLDVTASSTAEVVYDFLGENDEEVSYEASVCLLTGILTDTGIFSNAATTWTSLGAASALLRRGAKIEEVAKHLMRNKPIAALRLWGTVLARLKHDAATGMASTALFRKEIAESGVEDEHVEGLSNFLNMFLDVKALLVLKELPNGLVKGSYRTIAPDVDVAALALAYGGGGHKKAAGFTIAGAITEGERGWTVTRAPVMAAA
ncbi:MAG: hypothetical protein RLZZ324_816 [Candidatus Parcubacteria bacterium]|jgi:phosphoesterase RecJ-like protein